MHSKLREQYPDAYVAIYQGNMVDYDTSELELYKRIEEKYPHEVVLIRQVLPEAEMLPVDYSRVRSNRFARGVYK